jgi:tight adherence protein B
MPVQFLLVGVVVALVGAGVAIFFAIRANRAQARPAADAPSPSAGAGHDRAPILTRLLSLGKADAALQQTLLAAGLLVRPSELAAVSLGLGCIAFSTALLAHRTILIGVGIACVAAWAPLLAVRVLESRRRAEFQTRLPDALDLIASALRSGYSFARALSLVAQEMKGPMSAEAQRVMDELAVGRSLDEALTRLAERQASDVRLFTAAVQIQTRVGGNLAEILLKTAGMVRLRSQLQSEVRALTAEGRLSASIISCIPLFLAVAVNVLNPGYLSPLFDEKLGRVILISGAGLWVVGIIAIKKLIAIDI